MVASSTLAVTQRVSKLVQAFKVKFNTSPWSSVRYSCTSHTDIGLMMVHTFRRAVLTIVSEDASLSSRQYSLLHFLQVRINSSLQLMHCHMLIHHPDESTGLHTVWPQPKQSRLTPITCVGSR
jgi:hypothetical protein